MNLFTLEGASKVYGERTALAPINLTIREGRSLGVIGESGSGKTTLTRLMLGFTRPSSGTVRYRDEPVVPGAFGPSRLRREVQLVLQDPFASLSPRMRVGQIIAEPLRLLHAEGNRRERVAEVLEAVDLDPELTGRYPHELSGGQRQRVAIARAIGPRPKVLVTDEPVSALDVSVRAHIIALLGRLRDAGLTLVVVSHDLGTVQHLTDDTLVLSHGRCVERATTAEILHAPQAPETKELLAAVPSLPR